MPGAGIIPACKECAKERVGQCLPFQCRYACSRVLCNWGVWQSNLLKRTSEIAVLHSYERVVLNNKMLRFHQSSHFCSVCVVLPDINHWFLFISAWQRWRSWNSSSIQLNLPNWPVTVIAEIFLPLLTSLIKLGNWTRVAQLELRTNTPTVVTWYWRHM